jgi:glycine/D-amino acid oxidase-like deaminating enzyme
VVASRQDRSFWLQDAGHPGRDACQRVVGELRTQVAILGGGLTGMWTAYRLKQRSPETDVLIVEADVCGGGASGRNGGQVHSWFESLDRLAAVTDEREAVRMALATQAAIEELAALQDSGTLDMGLRLDGWLWTASSPAQEGSWEPTLAACERAGVMPYRRLDADQIRALVGPSASYQGVLEERAGSLHPGKLCAGLRALLLGMGVRIYERSPVTAIHAGPPAVLATPAGTVTADRVLIANNAWATSLPELRRYVYTVDSAVIVTEPVPDLLDELGWTSGVAVCDSQLQVLYYQRTVDGRVQLGRGSGGLVFGDRVGARQNRNPAELAPSRAELARVYPQLQDVAVDYDWTGPIDCTASHVPLLGTLAGRPNLFYCVGWNGTALAQIPAVSHILASLLLGVDDEWARSGLARQHRPKPIPREPLRFLGATVVRQAVRRKNRLEIRNRRVDPVTEALVRLRPH